MYVHIYVVDILHLPQLPDQSWGVEFWLRIACLIPDRHRINSRTEARSAIGLLRDNNHIHTFASRASHAKTIFANRASHAKTGNFY